MDVSHTKEKTQTFIVSIRHEGQCSRGKGGTMQRVTRADQKSHPKLIGSGKSQASISYTDG